jgi:hypothetical protein
MPISLIAARCRAALRYDAMPHSLSDTGLVSPHYFIAAIAALFAAH